MEEQRLGASTAWWTRMAAESTSSDARWGPRGRNHSAEFKGQNVRLRGPHAAAAHHSGVAQELHIRNLRKAPLKTNQGKQRDRQQLAAGMGSEARQSDLLPLVQCEAHVTVVVSSTMSAVWGRLGTSFTSCELRAGALCRSSPLCRQRSQSQTAIKRNPGAVTTSVKGCRSPSAAALS